MSVEPSQWAHAPTLLICVETFLVVLIGTQLIPMALLVAPVYWLLWIRGLRGMERIQSGSLQKGQLRHEISYSLLSAVIFSAVMAAVMAGWLHGAFPKFYLHPAEHGWPYFAGSIGATLVVQDVLFYPLHRLLHSRPFASMHAIHHRSKIPTPFAFNSFHPVEALFQILHVPVAMALFPVSPLALIISVGVISNYLNVYGHCNFEPRPQDPVSRLVSGVACVTPFHSHHHARYRGNYGLYFIFWDRLFGTAFAEEPVIRAQAKATGPGQEKPS